jgi:hypothetical protein
MTAARSASVVVLAGHDHQWLAAGFDAVADRAHPVFVAVGGRDTAGAGIDARPGDLEALAVIDDDAPAAIGAVAIAAAARAEEVAPAFQGRGVGGRGDGLHRYHHLALHLLRCKLRGNGHGRSGYGQKADCGDRAAADPFVHRPLQVCRLRAGVARGSLDARRPQRCRSNSAAPFFMTLRAMTVRWISEVPSKMR